MIFLPLCQELVPTNEDEPCHLKIPDQDSRKHAELNWTKYRGVEQRFCPAGVYEYIEDELEPLGVKFQINSQNCIHCKTCDIKVPSQDITWSVPEGGDGPKYTCPDEAIKCKKES